MNSFRLLLITFIVLFTIPCSAQVIKSKDGVSLGDRDEFISGCIKGAGKSNLKIKGLEIETNKYCSCICDNLIPTLNSWDIEEAVKENKLTDIFLLDKNLEIIMKCLEGNFTINEDYKFGSSDNVELQMKIGTKNCVNEIMNDKERNPIWTKELAEEYCTCAISKLLSAGYTYKDILDIEDENSTSFNEIALPCVTEVLKTSTELKSSNSYNVNDIKGGTYRSIIPLVDYLEQGYKIKINISGVIKYYLFDTGASDLLINRDTERELLLKGVLKKENYLYKTEYTLANSQIVKAQMIKLDNIIIGDYTLNNVTVAIIDEGSLLCGKSFLDKFKNWEIDKQNKVLILYK